MLSDSIRVLRQSKENESGKIGEALILRGFEIEARNMEERLQQVTGRPHVPFDGNLVSQPDGEAVQP
ncbi:hypothetical protein B5K11_09640 [Rhizobium leguminosarum bv. trifolii]|uniref:hypothetical protein n=1 Tax=Rhizobium leguminosarum TaxID=384 RepID=UPI000E2F1E18|nr:hypothetical protein [Rhizobium leguminosarum]RFB95205.1 hypothetical protein B5K11_09640 [Rhizobium leguminosarum bv. trifolii]